MPKRKIHESVTKLLLGQSYTHVDEIIDFPVKFLGPSHRKLFHTLPESFLLGLLMSGEIRGGLAGLLHVLTDNIDSNTRKEINKLFNNRGDRNCRKKRQKRRKKNQ